MEKVKIKSKKAAPTKKVVAIKWKQIEVDVTKIKPTPNNFKLKTEEGASRFKTSVDNFGLAGSVIINTDFTLIDGNTRLEKAKELGHKKIWASVPDRRLTPKEFTEFAAMYDFAKAGEVDVLRIKEELGTTKSFFDKWGMDMPESAQAALGGLEEADGGKVVANPKKPKVEESGNALQLRPVSLLFSPDEANEYIEIAEKLYSRHKVDNVTDLSLIIMRQAAKAKK